MADTKISALPASTTPLAGTEVLPIVQSGVTAKVSVANLTAGRAVSTGALTVASADATIYGLTVGRGGGAVSTNTAVGSGALPANSSGSSNSAFGLDSLALNTSGSSNTALGRNTLLNNLTGGSNTAAGVSALITNTGSYNSAFGSDALYSNTTASNNTAVGYQAGYGITSGGGSVCIGPGAGYSGTALTTGYNDIYIGYAQASVASAYGEFVVGAQGNGSAAVGKGSHTGFIYCGGGGVYQGNNSLSWSVTSDQRIKKNIVDNNIGLNVINQIQVRNFEYRLPEEITELPQDQAIKKTGVQLGVIAQELQQILPECVKTESTGVMTVDADNLTWYLINAVKELTARVAQLESKP